MNTYRTRTTVASNWHRQRSGSKEAVTRDKLQCRHGYHNRTLTFHQFSSHLHKNITERTTMLFCETFDHRIFPDSHREQRNCYAKVLLTSNSRSIVSTNSPQFFFYSIQNHEKAKFEYDLSVLNLLCQVQTNYFSTAVEENFQP